MIGIADIHAIRRPVRLDLGHLFVPRVGNGEIEKAVRANALEMTIIDLNGTSRYRSLGNVEAVWVMLVGLVESDGAKKNVVAIVVDMSPADVTC
jgi:hypothetical protein